jgi:HPr kinase/phosphorylase
VAETKPSGQRVAVTVLQLVDESDGLGLQLQCGASGLDREIRSRDVQKPGLVLAGLQRAHGDAVHVMGKAEAEYLSARSPEEQRRILLDYVRSGVPCVVLCWGLPPIQALLAIAEESGVPLFTTPLSTGVFIGQLKAFLDEALAIKEDRHGVLVQVHDLGVLIVGSSGIGKSETALELVLRGHRMVADDRVCLVRSGDEITGSGVAPLGHFMEVRGLGIIHAGDLFGQAAVMETARVDLVVELVDWSRAPQADRTGLDTHTVEILGAQISHILLPVRPGRNLATIIEVAVRNQILRQRGIHSAERFNSLLEKGLLADPDEE